MELPEEELDAMSYGEQIARATAASLAPTGIPDPEVVEAMSYDEQIARATAASLEDFVRGSADSRRQQQQQAMPDFLVVDPVVPNGWCFYDCVHRHLESAASDLPGLSPSLVAALCLLCLIEHQETMPDVANFVYDSAEIHARRVEGLRRVAAYDGISRGLSRFEAYILDKLETVLYPEVVRWGWEAGRKATPGLLREAPDFKFDEFQCDGNPF